VLYSGTRYQPGHCFEVTDDEDGGGLLDIISETWFPWMMTKGERKHHSNCGDEITNVIAYWYALASRYVPSFITIVGKQCIYSFLLMTKTGRNVMLGYILNTLSDTPIRMASTWYCVLVPPAFLYIFPDVRKCVKWSVETATEYYVANSLHNVVILCTHTGMLMWSNCIKEATGCTTPGIRSLPEVVH